MATVLCRLSSEIALVKLLGAFRFGHPDILTHLVCLANVLEKRHPITDVK